MSATIHVGDALEVLRTLPDGLARCCVTSPPYWGLRDYGTAGQLGLEPTPEEYVSRMVEVFREVRRVLADDGTLWLNIGDSYATGAGRVGDHPGGGDQGARWKGATTQPNRMPLPGLKPKDLVGIPWRLAFALQADGWWLRSDIIWSKPNPMPESVRDRPTKAHEYLFMLAKAERYYYNAEAIAEASAYGPRACAPGARNISDAAPERRTRPTTTIYVGESRNRRTVWTIATQPFPEAHFAVMPPALAEPCILAGSQPEDVVLDPFSGAGTTGLVARRQGRRFVGIELNPAYAEMAQRRIRDDAPLLNEVMVARVR